MVEYNDIHPNKDNINNFNEGITDHNIRDRRLSYQYNALSRKEHPGFKLSLACSSATDIAHTVGNVAAVGLQFILDLFPNGTFKTAIPSTAMAYRQLRHTPKQIRTQPYPICVVSPQRISLSGLDNRLAAGSFATTTWNTTSNRFQNRSEMDVLLSDTQKKILWRGKINRVVVYLDFVLSFRSMTEQQNWAGWLINQIPTDGGFFDIDTGLELALPDGFLEATSKFCGIPVKDENGNVSAFVDYLNMNGVFPASYRFSSGRHKDAFYMSYSTSIMCNIGDLTYSAGTKSGLVEADYPISFTMRCEFNTIGKYDLCVPNPGPYVDLDPPKSSIAIPIFSDVWNEKDFPLEYGWKIQSRPIIKMDYGEREVNISGTFSNELNLLIDYHLKHHIPVEMFISVKLRENKCLIDDGYYVDWKRRTLVIDNMNYTHTYRLIIAVNKLYINNMLNKMYG